jgi:shikimate kinase
MDKLDCWAEVRRASLKVELAELDDAIRETRKAARLAPNLPEKLERQRELRKLDTRRDDAWRNYDQASRELDRQKDSLLDEISQRLEQHSENEVLFTLRWKLK